MTRILYIPTGEYLKYYTYLNENEITIESVLEEIMGKEDIEIEIEEILSMEQHKTRYSDWIKLNNLILPVLPNELEIIYD
jgi:hypothetical protein